jgi:choline kinase
MTMRRMQHAVILAAGMGRRLAAISGGRPKALFPVNGRTLFDYACDFAEAVAEDRIVVGGFGCEELKDRIRTGDRSAVRLVCVEDYQHGNIVSLLAAIPHLDGSALIMNVDHVYCKEVRALVSSPRSNMTVFCDKARTLGHDDMKVALCARGHVRAISKRLESYHTGYVGLTYVPAADMDRYRRAVVDTVSREGTDAAAENVIQSLVNDDIAVDVCDLGGLKWAEVDTPADAHELAHRSDLFD